MSELEAAFDTSVVIALISISISRLDVERTSKFVIAEPAQGTKELR